MSVKKKQIITQVDSFTNKPFAGNPSGVCILDKAADEVWMKNVAKEMNLSETAFLYPEKDGYNLRWFTPTIEVDLCGHATLASVHVLWEEGHLESSAEARFYTRSGLLTACKNSDWIEMNFPATPILPINDYKELVEAMSVKPIFAGKGKVSYLIEVGTVDEVRAVRPNFSKLAELKIRSVMVTAKGDDGKYDFVSRYFAPGVGILEDPVTGAAHCALGPYWMGRLNRKEFLAYQASARGGEVRVRVENDRVFLGGQAITVMRCELTI